MFRVGKREERNPRFWRNLGFGFGRHSFPFQIAVASLSFLDFVMLLSHSFLGIA